MTTTTTSTNAADALRAIISAGVAAYQNSLPDYARDDQRADQVEEPAYTNIAGVDECRQLEVRVGREVRVRRQPSRRLKAKRRRVASPKKLHDAVNISKPAGASKPTTYLTRFGFTLRSASRE